MVSVPERQRTETDDFGRTVGNKAGMYHGGGGRGEGGLGVGGLNRVYWFIWKLRVVFWYGRSPKQPRTDCISARIWN